jgi:hypothetical protein
MLFHFNLFLVVIGYSTLIYYKLLSVILGYYIVDYSRIFYLGLF